ncbi:MAG TPA: GNAT family N-acetyltransferase [Chloroflexota bacterium]|nr:GNAT family N-acetyltransferase [Chloroflexota bacterium]
MDARLRLLTEDDIEDGAALLEAAYGRPGTWRQDLTLHLALDPDLWFGAEMRGRLVGIGGARWYETFAWIGLMGVLPACGGLGLGGRILDRVIEAARERGAESMVLDASAAGERLYLSRGFSDHGITTLFERASQGDALPACGVEVAGIEDLEALAAFDASLFAADRTAALAALLSQPSTLAYVSRAGGDIAGYIMARDKRIIGPWLALNDQAAGSLLAAVLTLAFDGPAQLRIPGQNPSAEAIARRAGFVEVRRLRHMALGPYPPQRRDRIYGEASFSLG